MGIGAEKDLHIGKFRIIADVCPRTMMKNIPSKPLFKLNQPDDTYKYKAPPAPAGDYPYRLKPALDLAAPDKMIFHVAGDTGGLKAPDFQLMVAREMARQYTAAENPEDRPSFLYHVGDIVYHFGEADQYQRQFFTPYAAYPLPIFAIPGNHDSDVNPLAEKPYSSLEPFREVFCGKEPHGISFAADRQRMSGTQPHVYWTMDTPLARIIGLHSNVPKYGMISEEQRQWFVAELQHASAGEDKALIVCLHHAPYSADFNHGSSLPMISFLEEAYAEAGVKPDLVLSGHVHDYQRFQKTYTDGKVVPYIVCGAGGFDELHWLAEADGLNYTDQSAVFDQVTLENACTMQHGFLQLTIERTAGGNRISGKYYAIPHEGLLPGEHAYLFEEFAYFCGNGIKQAL